MNIRFVKCKKYTVQEAPVSRSRQLVIKTQPACSTGPKMRRRERWEQKDEGEIVSWGY